MSNELQQHQKPRRLWPRLLLMGLLLGIVLFVVWVWFAVQQVKRIKASTQGLTSWRQSGTRPVRVA